MYNEHMDQRHQERMRAIAYAHADNAVLKYELDKLQDQLDVLIARLHWIALATLPAEWE